MGVRAMDKAQAEAAVGELSQRLGISGVSLGEAGNCLLAIDDGAVLVHLGYNPGAASIDLMLCLDEIRPSPADLARLMTANFAWIGTDGATFALEPQTGALVVARRCNASDIVNHGLQRALESLVGVAEAWSKRLARSAAMDGGDEETSPEARTPAMGVIRA